MWFAIANTYTDRRLTFRNDPQSVADQVPASQCLEIEWPQYNVLFALNLQKVNCTYRMYMSAFVNIVD